MESRILIKDQDIEKEEPITLVSPRNPTPVQTHFLSNLDQTVAFPVETLFFFRPSPGERTSIDILEKVKKSVSDVLLIPYYFMAGRLNLNIQSNRLELVCNNAGALFVGARSRLGLKDLGNVALPNPSFWRLLLRIDGFMKLSETPLLTIQAILTFSLGVIGCTRITSGLKYHFRAVGIHIR